MITVILVIFLPSILSEETVNANITTTSIDFPKLFVIKSVEKSEVYLGDSFTVTITIKNYGNQTAYNVTFSEQLNNPWVFEVSGITKLSYNQIGENETKQFSYIIIAKSLGRYQLNAGKLDYYDSEVNPNKYIAYSNSPEIIVNAEPEDFSLENFNAAISLLLILLIGNFLLIARLISQKLNRRKNDG